MRFQKWMRVGIFMLSSAQLSSKDLSQCASARPARNKRSMISPAEEPRPRSIRQRVVDDKSVVYELQASGPLPVIDCSMSLKRALFSTRFLKRYNAFQRATKVILRTSFAASLVLACMFVFLGRRTGQWIALASCILQIPPVTNAYLLLRRDIIVLLIKTYEFWYITIVSLVSNAVLCVSFNDFRASLVVCLVITYQFMMLMDANIRDPTSAIIGSLVGAMALLSFVVLEVFDLIKDYSDGQLVQYGKWTIKGSDIVINGIFTILLVMVRNAYRKRSALAHMDRDSATVRCITYRTRIKFVEPPSCTFDAVEPLPPPPPRLVTESSPSLPMPSSMSQMRLVPLNLKLYACDFIQTSVPLPSGASPYINRLWTLVGAAGLVITAGSLVWRPYQLDLAASGLACSALYCVRCFMFHNRRLLRHMLWSFDFLFLSVQSCLAHIVLCYLLHWKVRTCLLVLSNWLWMFWVITLDLLAPLVRRRLGVSLRLAYAVLVLQLVGHVWLTLDIVHQHTLAIDDRVLFRMYLVTHEGILYAVPFLLNRMVTTFCWCARLLWRLRVRSENELLMIHGAVEYDDYDAYRRRRGANQRRGGGGGKRRVQAALEAPTARTSVP